MKTNKSKYLIETILAVLCFIVCLGAIGFADGKNPFTALAGSLYSPEQNLIFVKALAGINANIIFVFIIITASLAVKIYRRSRGLKENVQASFVSAAVIVSLLAIVQIINFTRYAYTQKQALQSLSPQEKKTRVFGDAYKFAEFCKKHMPGKQKGRLVTDVNINIAEGVYEHIVLSYNLYPITIQNNPRQMRLTPNYAVERGDRHPPEVLVVYKKDNPAKALPSNYEILEWYDQKSYVAVRRNR